MKLTAVIVACALALTPQVCDGGTLCWTVEADDKLAQVECEHFDERTYAHRSTVEYGFAVAVGAVFDGCVGLLLWTVDLMIFLVYWLASWYVPSLEVLWRQAFMECVEVYVSFFDVNQPLLVPTFSTMAVISFCVMICCTAAHDDIRREKWESKFSFILVCMPFVMSACLLVLTVAVILVPIVAFVIATLFLTFAWVVLFVLILLIFVILLLFIFLGAALMFLVVCALVTLIGLVLMILLLVIPMALVMVLTAVVLGSVAFGVRGDRRASAPKGCKKHVAKVVMMVGNPIVALIELLVDFCLVNACFIVFSDIAGIRFAYLRKDLASSLLRESVVTAWLASVAGVVEGWAVTVGRLVPLLTEWMNMTCSGPNSLFAAAQLTMALMVIKIMNSRSNNLQVVLNYIAMKAEYCGGWRTLYAKLGKVVLMQAIQILLQSSAYLILFHPVAKAQCTFEGDVILAIIGHLILLVCALHGLYIAPQVLGFGDQGGLDQVSDFVFGQATDDESKLSKVFRLLQITFGYWSIDSVDHEIMEHSETHWVESVRHVENFLNLTAECLSMGLLLFPLGNFLQKLVAGFNEGFIMGPGRKHAKLGRLVAPDVFAKLQKFLAVVRAIAMGVTVLVPDETKMPFWILTAVCTVGKTVCDDMKQKNKPEMVNGEEGDLQSSLRLMTYVRPVCEFIINLARGLKKLFVSFAAFVAKAFRAVGRILVSACRCFANSFATVFGLGWRILLYMRDSAAKMIPERRAKKNAKEDALKMANRAEELLRQQNELNDIVESLQSKRGYVKSSCGAAWKQWSTPGKCQRCATSVDRMERGLQCADGDHHMCWKCMCEQVDWDRIHDEEQAPKEVDDGDTRAGEPKGGEAEPKSAEADENIETGSDLF